MISKMVDTIETFDLSLNTDLSVYAYVYCIQKYNGPLTQGYFLLVATIYFIVLGDFRN